MTGTSPTKRPARRTAILLAVVSAVAAVLVGCGDSGDPEVLDFALVQDGEFAFEADPTNPERGVFRVRTTEPMICAIVWGETEDFGRINNSLTMNGTGIVDHDVVLPGAVAGRTYYFRVQGSTADGGQYRSGTATFTIPALEDSGDVSGVEVGENLAMGATIVEASSSFGPGWEPENAIDGDTATEWATRGDGDAGSITIDLGSERRIAAVEFVTRSMLDGSAITDTYTVAVDGGELLGPFTASSPALPEPVEISAVGRVLTFEVATSSGGNVGAVEIRVHAPLG